ncbi:hypothetical protein CJD36_004930 [Flavipsychrobacter stenotrophus]|uniref:Signal transduction histidine kinase internal region domain-containing protein n=1 Tax=Flavipsychrobacter stenotrophus TaxID=2077091 RepID=A0A2S7T2I6_9BACT|nr:sensor histidine kinase [Flavipsychrobacter stenotrophus]PQJ13091.1 hypothetical protein CJD36_004930 [Flavipsychrobacter stenotrophus]
MTNNNDITQILKNVGIHTICWVAFLFLPELFNEHLSEFGLVGVAEDFIYPPRVANNTFFIALFYFSYFKAVPSYYVYRKFIFLAVYVFTAFTVFLMINYLFKPFSHSHHHQSSILGPSYNLFMFIICLISSFAMRTYTNWRSVYEEKLNAEISFLKAQINPHFLFNTLNSIYSLTITKSDDAPEAVLKLSGMMRYAVSDTGNRYVSLEKELDYILNYIELQKLRLDKNIIFNYSITGSAFGKKLAPFVLIPFIENAFKHGVNAEQESNININIEIAEASMQMQVWNRKVTIYKSEENSTGTGIINTRTRLQMLYPGKHVLTIHDRETDFSVLLKIDLV